MSGDDFEKDREVTEKIYRLWFYDQGETREINDPGEAREEARRGFTREEVEAENKSGGKLPLVRLIRHRVRYFTEGVVLGSADLVDRVIDRHRSQFGTNRKSGVGKMKDAEWEGLHVLRALRRDVIGWREFT